MARSAARRVWRPAAAVLVAAAALTHAPSVPAEPPPADQVVTVDFKEADLHDVFRLVAKVARVNVVVSEEVQGRLTLHLTRVTWRQLLDVVLQAHGLVGELEGEVLWITTLRDYRARLKLAVE